MTKPVINLCVYIEGQERCIDVSLPLQRTIYQLKKIIYDEHANFIAECDPSKLTLKKVDVCLGEVEDKIDNTGQYELDAPHQRPLWPSLKISKVWPEPPSDGRLHVFVGLPVGVQGRPTPVQMGGQSARAKAHDLWSAVTINAPAQNNFGGQGSLEPNKIFELHGPEPDFFMEFRTKLRQRRWIESDTNHVLLLKEELPEFENYFEDAPTGVEQGDRVSGKYQLLHLACAFLLEGWKQGNVEERSVRWIFDELGGHFHSVLGSREGHAFRADWPFELIISVESEQKKYRYTPQSGFHASVDRLVYLFVEVQSETNDDDRYQMLLQAACAARLGRQFYKEPFIVMALYIENCGRVTRYFVFQRDADTTVHYVSDRQDWTQSSELFDAMFENYNLVSMIQSDRPELGNIRERIGSLNSDIQNEYKDTFISKRTYRDAGGDGTTPSKRHRASHGGQGGNAGNGMRRDEHVYGDRQVVDAFTRAGFTLESNDEDEDGWAPLNQLKPTMRHAIQSNGTAIVVKLHRSDSHELRILERLHSIESPYNHAIPLLKTFELDTRTFIFLPEAIPIDLGFNLGRFRSEFVDFSRQLIEGVGFLHCHGIAHLDIKPQNIVVRQNQLFITDFDISICVGDPNALIDHWCGTPGWMAPEVGCRDGPRCLYSPIRADLWSCGQMLRYLARESNGAVKENPFEALTSQLLNRKPLLRPLLYLPSSVTVNCNVD